MLARYILSSVCLRLSQFLQCNYVSCKHMGLCAFSLPICLVMIVRMCVLFLIIIVKWEVWPIYPLFRLRSWNNDMCCMSFYILNMRSYQHYGLPGYRLSPSPHSYVRDPYTWDINLYTEMEPPESSCSSGNPWKCIHHTNWLIYYQDKTAKGHFLLINIRSRVTNITKFHDAIWCH